MKGRVLVLLAAAAALLAFTGQGWSATFTLGTGTFSPSSCTPVCDGSFSGTTNGVRGAPLADFHTFTVTDGTLLQTASATNSSANPAEEIDQFEIELFSGTPTGSSTMRAPRESGAFFNNTIQFAGSVPLTPLSPGAYFLEVVGFIPGLPTTYDASRPKSGN